VKFNVVTGLPRSGSTLLCNILNQNPRCYASSTSPLPGFLSGLIHAWSSSIEVKSLLHEHKDETENRIRACAEGLVNNWYSHKDEELIFDKSRLWTTSSLMLKSLYPNAKLIVCVRSLIDVFASIEKQYTKNPLLDDATNPTDKTIYTRADTMFSSDGLIGGPIIGIEDLIRRDPDGVIFIMYESLVRQPDMIMEKLYAQLNEPLYDHDFDNVENTAEDPDGFYLHKFPHEGSGKVQPPAGDEWKRFISRDLASTITGRFPDYCKYFNYTS
jgi:sulfotransferase